VLETPELLDRTVDSVMDAPYPVLDAHVEADEVRRILQRGNAACLVRQGSTLEGIVTRYVLVRALTGAAV
jgi:predicted transcriptional regulator